MRTRRRSARVQLPVLIVLLGLLALISLPPAADETDAAIQDVILTQIEAFANDDELGAWVHASRSIQKRLRSPEMLMYVVQNGYPPVHRPASIRFGERIPHDEFEIQVVRLQGPEGGLWDAYYRMVFSDREWKVGGVTLQRAEVGI